MICSLVLGEFCVVAISVFQVCVCVFIIIFFFNIWDVMPICN